MKDLVLIGAGGCMRELLWQIREYNQWKPSWNIVGYVDKIQDLNMEQSCPYLGTDEDFVKTAKPVNVALTVANPQLREKIVTFYRQNPNIFFPVICLSKDGIAPDAVFGEGCIISRECIVSTNVVFGEFVFANMRSMVCHDGRVGNYTTLAPGANIAGNVTIGAKCEMGIGCTTIQGIEIGNNVRVGAGAVVVNNLPSDITAVGVPAKGR